MAEWLESNYSRDTSMRLARSGALVRIVCAEDACDVCQARARQIYTPSDVPRLPIRGCLRAACRCRFVAIDPETELTVPQLVERGITALRAGRSQIALEMLRRAVSLDEMYEFGWLWLGAVVDDLEKIHCLEKVLAINPRNQRARAGLEALQRKLARTRPLILSNLAAVPAAEPGQEEAPAPADEPEFLTQAVEEAAVEAAAPVTDMQAAAAIPTEVFDLREERQVIAEQWSDFVQIAIETDPHMLTMQGQAFLKKLDRLGEQALVLLPDEEVLGELQLQWSEMERMGASLLATIETHRSRRDGTRAWQAMNDALRDLAHGMSEQGKSLRTRIVQTGGRITRKA